MASTMPLVKALQSLDFQPTHARQLRALFIAQVVGYQVKLEIDKTAEEMVSEHEDALKRILNDINESVAIDVRLTQQYFAMVVKTRYQIFRGVGDPVLLRHLIQSQAQADNASLDTQAALESLASRGEFAKAADAALINVEELLTPEGE